RRQRAAHHGRLSRLQPCGRHHADRLARSRAHGVIRPAHHAHRGRPFSRHHGGPMKRWLYQHRYAFAVALRRLLSQPFSSLCNILVISLSLAVPIVVAAVLDTARPVVQQIPVSAEVTLYLERNAPPDAARALADTPRTQHAQVIDAIEVIDREAALAELRRRPAWSEALAVLPENPLPDAVVVTLRQHPEIAATSERLSAQWQALD